MNKALPKIKETEAEIREMLKSEQQVKRQNRLQALYLIVSRQAESRSQVSKMLGFNRNTISEWFSLYEAGGLEKLLEIYRPCGAKAKITAAAMAEISEILKTEKGFRTYKEIHQLVAGKHKIEVGYRAVHNVVRYKLEAKLKSPRPSNPKKTKSKSKNSSLESERNLRKLLSSEAANINE
ncbi:MAG: helix-turn-helix domain-containing protein [Acidobacteria bacterium]|nr:helix-turn-helix domain-containing protein [Acidobacteriota bacterium]